MHDVTVEDRTGDRLIVIAPSAHRCDEELMVQMTTSIGTAMQTARVVSSRLVTVHGKMCFRVELRLNPASPALAGREAV